MWARPDADTPTKKTNIPRIFSQTTKIWFGSICVSPFPFWDIWVFPVEGPFV